MDIAGWRDPLGSTPMQGARPTAGQLVAWDWKPWRVLSVDDVPDELWSDRDRQAVKHYSPKWLADNPDARPYRVRLRPASIDVPWLNHDADVHLRCVAGKRARWHSLPEHYPVCSHCQELVPCLDVRSEDAAARAIAKMGRYERQGVCPACEEQVTHRQARQVFPENLEVLGGPPVTFHTRAKCWSSMADYEKRWVAADPERRRAHWSCAGAVTTHNDGTYDCTQGDQCPGPQARHTSYSVCGCPDCHAQGSFDCTPRPGAVRNGSTTTLL